jgi:hypothetical protein
MIYRSNYTKCESILNSKNHYSTHVVFEVFYNPKFIQVVYLKNKFISIRGVINHVINWGSSKNGHFFGYNALKKTK